MEAGKDRPDGVDIIDDVSAILAANCGDAPPVPTAKSIPPTRRTAGRMKSPCIGSDAEFTQIPRARASAATRAFTSGGPAANTSDMPSRCWS